MITQIRYQASHQHRMTAKQMIQRYRDFKSRYVPVARRPYEYPINKYYAHLIDPFFTWAAFRLGASANQVTLFSAFVDRSLG